MPHKIIFFVNCCFSFLLRDIVKLDDHHDLLLFILLNEKVNNDYKFKNVSLLYLYLSLSVIHSLFCVITEAADEYICNMF